MRDICACVTSWWSFRGSGTGTMAFLAGRMAVLPLGALDTRLRSLRGRVLSLGCGYGLAERYLVRVDQDVHVVGLELDERRVEVAARSAHRAPRVEIRAQDVRTLSSGEAYDAAIAIDVMHHVPASNHADLAAALYRALRPGGRCLVKDIATTPRWKHAFNRLHDRIVTGRWVHAARSPQDMANVFVSQGFELMVTERYGRFGPYPHYLVAVRKPFS